LFLTRQRNFIGIGTVFCTGQHVTVRIFTETNGVPVFSIMFWNEPPTSAFLSPGA
jgi:hypothetical protein